MCLTMACLAILLSSDAKKRENAKNCPLGCKWLHVEVGGGKCVSVDRTRAQVNTKNWHLRRESVSCRLMYVLTMAMDNQNRGDHGISKMTIWPCPLEVGAVK